MAGLPPVVIVLDCYAGPFGIAARAEEMVESGISRAACAVRATVAKGRLWCWLASILNRLPARWVAISTRPSSATAMGGGRRVRLASEGCARCGDLWTVGAKARFLPFAVVDESGEMRGSRGAVFPIGQSRWCRHILSAGAGRKAHSVGSSFPTIAGILPVRQELTGQRLALVGFAGTGGSAPWLCSGPSPCRFAACLQKKDD